MKDHDARKGIHDPWRMHSADREKEPDEQPVGAPGSSHPLDADLLPHVEYVFRHPRAACDLLIYGAEEATGAADVLTAVLDALPPVVEELHAHGITVVNTDDLDGSRGFFIKGSKRAIYIGEAKSIAEGLTCLARALRQSNHKAELEKAGVIPLIK